MVGDIRVGIAEPGLAMPGHEQGFGGLIGLDNRVEMARLMAAFHRTGGGEQGFEDFEPLHAGPLIGRLGAVGEIGVEIIAGGVLRQAQPGRQFRIVREFVGGNRVQQFINLTRNPAGCARIVHRRGTGGREREDCQPRQGALQGKSDRG